MATADGSSSFGFAPADRSQRILTDTALAGRYIYLPHWEQGENHVGGIRCHFGSSGLLFRFAR